MDSNRAVINKLKSITFSLMEFFIRNISGGLGIKIRYFYYKNRFKSCGVNVRIEENVLFYNPDNIVVGNDVLFMHNSSITAKPLGLKITNRIETKIIINKIIHGLLNEQNNYFIDSMKNERDLTKIPEQANIFRNYMKNCSKKGFEEIIVSFLAAESMYNNWCSNALVRKKKNLNNYIKWIKIHTSKAFFNQVKFFSQEAKLINKSESPSKKQKEIFRETLIHEISFHDSIYN